MRRETITKMKQTLSKVKEKGILAGRGLLDKMQQIDDALLDQDSDEISDPSDEEGSRGTALDSLLTHLLLLTHSLLTHSLTHSLTLTLTLTCSLMHSLTYSLTQVVEDGVAPVPKEDVAHQYH